MISLNLTLTNSLKILNFTRFFLYLVLLKLLGLFVSWSREVFDTRPWFLFVHLKSVTHTSQTVSIWAVDGTLISFSENYYRSEKKNKTLDTIMKPKCEEDGPIYYKVGSEKS